MTDLAASPADADTAEDAWSREMDARLEAMRADPVAYLEAVRRGETFRATTPPVAG